MKLEVADLEQPQIIRVATITNIMGRMLQLFFDGQSKFQFVDFESPDIYPIGWCKRTGHTLHSPFGPSKCLYVAFAVPYDWVYLLMAITLCGYRAGFPVSVIDNFYGMGGLAPCPTPNLEGQGFLSACPSLSHNIPLFERRQIPAFLPLSPSYRTTALPGL